MDLITDDMNIERKAVCPIIVSASRATDIPAFYSDWLINRIKKGYVKWKNPFNGKYSYVSFAQARLFVFWTKNPKPIMDKLNYFDDHGFHYYFHYTLNDYEREGWEKCLPPLNQRIDSFIQLSQKIGKEKVIWRFDPIILTDKLGKDEIVERIKDIGDQIYTYTNKLVFSYIDVECYRKVSINLGKLNPTINEIDINTMESLAFDIAKLNKKWSLSLGTCAENIDLETYGIEHNRCIDDRLIVKLFSEDEKLMEYLGYKRPDQSDIFMHTQMYNYNKIKDKGQRKACGCIQSKDIGQYNTCPHGCVYCYANTNHHAACNNFKKTTKDSEMLL